MAVKECLHCEVEKPLEDFPVDRRRRDGRRSHCNVCNVKLALQYQRSHPENHASRSRKYRYGLSAVLYEIVFGAQLGVCAICKRPQRSQRRLAVDHCHRTQRFRGLLCNPCNSILGFADDSVELLQAAIEYLKKEPVWQ